MTTSAGALVLPPICKSELLSNPTQAAHPLPSSSFFKKNTHKGLGKISTIRLLS